MGSLFFQLEPMVLHGQSFLPFPELTAIILIGLLTFYSLLILFYVAGIGLYAHKVWMTISKGGPMHEVRRKMHGKVSTLHWLTTSALFCFCCCISHFKLLGGGGEEANQHA